MLFYTPEFLFLFLPITLFAYFLIGRFSWKAAFGWLVIMRLHFNRVCVMTKLPLIVYNASYFFAR